jgi:hypothetical protein
MKDFKLHKKFLLDGESVSEIEACVEAMWLLKETDRYNTSSILALLTAYLQLPIEEIDPEQKDEIARVCANLNDVFEMVHRSHLLNNLTLTENG